MAKNNKLVKSSHHFGHPFSYNHLRSNYPDSHAISVYTMKEETVITNQVRKGSQFLYPYRFAYGFWNCFEDCRVCALATYCYPCFVHSLYMASNEGKCSACIQCFFGITLLGCLFSNLSILRTKIRGTYRLHGSIAEDVLYTRCFPCCAAVQMYQELRSQEEMTYDMNGRPSF